MNQNLTAYREGGGNIKKAKLFYNVIDDAMLNIPIDQVIVCFSKDHLKNE